jgi:hypothetical protein
MAAEFADKLTALTRGVLGQGTPRFDALNLGRRVRVAPMDEAGKVQRIPVSIGGEPVLSLLVDYLCCWDGSSTFLATDEAAVKVYFDGAPEPLFRFEYVRTSKEPPGAHIQVHAHRDEVAYLLRLADTGRPSK